MRGMARKPRLEQEGGCYHLINRGNYRQDVFTHPRTRRAFLKCVDETHRKTGWRSFGVAVMINHYHLATQTPQPTLVAGMQWLQGTFAMRFNGLRDERGHLFQGRYRSILLDPDTRLGPTCHYIHLNPVRAGVATVDELANYPWTSVRWLMHPAERPEWFDPRVALLHAGGLQDTVTGRRAYLAYLRWLMENQDAQQTMGFADLEKGWAQGSPEFLHEVVRVQGRVAKNGEPASDDLIAAREAFQQQVLDDLLKEHGRAREVLRTTSKSAEWKVAIAAALKRQTTATNAWLSAELHLGYPTEVSRMVSDWNKRQRRQFPLLTPRSKA